MSEHIDTLKEIVRTRVIVRAKDERIVHGFRALTDPHNWLFDFRRVILEPMWADIYAEVFWERFATQYPFQVGGMETAALPLIAAVVMKGVQRGTPVNGFYIRKSRDKDGLMRQIEGTLSEHPIILVDDLMNVGTSFLKQVKVLEANGRTVAEIFAILAFRTPDAYRTLTEHGIRLHHLFTLADFDLSLSDEGVVPYELFDTVWKFSAGGARFEHVFQKSAPIIDANNIYFGTDKGTFYAIDQSSGTIAWQRDVEKHLESKGIFSSPALHDGVVYFGAYDGNVYALDAATGEKRWVNSDADWIGSSPALAPKLGLLYIGLELGLFRKRGGIAAIDLQTGVTRWKDKTTEYTHGSPLYIAEENMVVVGSNDGIIYAYDAQNGERKWIYTAGSDIKTRPSYDAQRRLILVPSYGGTLLALSARSGELLWTFTTAGFYTNPVIVGNVVYIASLDKTLYCLELDTGKIKWEFETLGRIFSTPVCAEGSLWIGSNDGRLYELDPATGISKGSHQFSERIVNAIAYNSTTRCFFVSTVANELYALKRKSVSIQ